MLKKMLRGREAHQHFVRHFNILENRLPVVAMTCCFTEASHLHHSRHGIGDKYVRALASGSKVIPLFIPCLEDVMSQSSRQWAYDVLKRVDGFLITGSPSNIHPSRYNEPVTEKHTGFDERRDAMVFPLIEAALELNAPTLGICRGHQEINVYAGGTICPNVNEVSKQYHGFPSDQPETIEGLDKSSMDYENIKYGDAHVVNLTPGGVLEEIMGRSQIKVNSCHYQAIEKLAPTLNVEGVSPVDGIVESTSIPGMDFGLTVQWHPEYWPARHPTHNLIYEAFGRAVRGEKRQAE